MSLALHTHLDAAAPVKAERLPVLACIGVWFAISGGLWAAIIGFLHL